MISDLIKTGLQIVIYSLNLDSYECIACAIIGIIAFIIGIVSLILSVFGYCKSSSKEKMEKYAENRPNDQTMNVIIQP